MKKKFLIPLIIITLYLIGVFVYYQVNNQKIETWVEKKTDRFNSRTINEIKSFTLAGESPVILRDKISIIYFLDPKEEKELLTLYKLGQKYEADLDIYWLYSCEEREKERFFATNPNISFQWMKDTNDLFYHYLGRSSYLVDKTGKVIFNFDIVTSEFFESELDKIMNK